MKYYSSGIAQTWQAANIHTNVLTYIKANPAKNETEIATALSLTIDQVMWALQFLANQGQIALVPESWSDYADHPHHGKHH